MPTPARRTAAAALIALAALPALAGGDGLQRAVALPMQAEALRAAGVPAPEVAAVLAAARDGAVPADEASARARRRPGPGRRRASGRGLVRGRV